MVEVPGTLAEVSAQWLDAALREPAADPANQLEVAVVALKVEPLGASVGLLGDLARLHVSYAEGDGPPTMIVKLPTGEPGGHQVGSMLRAWAREDAFYREVAPQSPGVKVPRCFHAGADEAAKRWVLVLEDHPGDPVAAGPAATADQAAAAVDSLAAFHASWWGAGRDLDWMPGFDSTGVGGLQQPWLAALPLFLERYGHLVPPPTGEWIQRFAPTLGGWSDRVAQQPLTVVHADYRVDNLLFTDDGVVMIDWQTALRGPGAMDLTSFCVTSLTIEDRRAAEPALIDRYLRGLAAGGVDVDADWFARSYDENLLWWMGQFANNLARLEPDDPATQAALDTMIERTYTAALDHDVCRLLS